MEEQGAGLEAAEEAVAVEVFVRFEDGDGLVELQRRVRELILVTIAQVLDGMVEFFRAREFILYSIGWSGRDDGGKRGRTTLPFTNGDWVWPD